MATEGVDMAETDAIHHPLTTLFKSYFSILIYGERYEVEGESAIRLDSGRKRAHISAR